MEGDTIDLNKDEIELWSSELIKTLARCDRMRLELNRVISDLGELQNRIQAETKFNQGIFEGDISAAGITKSTRDGTKSILDIIREVSKRNGCGSAPKEVILERAAKIGIDRMKANDIIDTLRHKGVIIEHRPGKFVIPEHP